MLGNCKRNKWCCFCSHWYDPACLTIKPLTGRDMYEIDQSAERKCSQINLKTKALHVCGKFKPKF